LAERLQNSAELLLSPKVWTGRNNESRKGEIGLPKLVLFRSQERGKLVGRLYDHHRNFIQRIKTEISVKLSAFAKKGEYFFRSG